MHPYFNEPMQLLTTFHRFA